MKPFYLEEYLASPERKVVTRAGNKVEIINTNGRKQFPIIGYVDNSEVPASWHSDGRFRKDCEMLNPFDLFFADEESEDERIIQMIGNTLRDAVLSERISETSYREMSTYLEKKKEQKPADWSEKDKEMLRTVIYDLKRHDRDAYTTEIKWLKSLRPQPKRRDTYYDIIHNILAMLKDMDFTQITPEHRVSLLNDIRVKCKNADECAEILDEPHWKPSEVQMDALGAVCEGDKLSISQQAFLRMLRCDLAKLMEE